MVQYFPDRKESEDGHGPETHVWLCGPCE